MMKPDYKKQKVCLVIGALPVSLVIFRGPLIKAIIDQGFHVYAAANGRDVKVESALAAIGCTYCPIRIARAGNNPIKDMLTLWDLFRLIGKTRPDIVLAYTIKPIIFGAIAACLNGVKSIFSMVEGLGRPFMPRESLSHAISSFIAKCLYRVGLAFSSGVFFLNPDDLNEFVTKKYVKADRAVLLNGIGVDLTYYARCPGSHSAKVRFLMIARLLKDKGVREYIAAARMVLKKTGQVEFVLMGDQDENPSSVGAGELEEWNREKIIQYIPGFVDDVRPFIENCHVYVLPSYREGTPRTVLEAMSIGRAIITTDVPGCRETVIDQENGFLVPAKDVAALARAMEHFILNPSSIEQMGERSRKIAEKKYDVRKVNADILKNMGIAG